MKPTLIIAEAGVNHNGSMDLAHRLIDAAADCGADIVKFQSFNSDALATQAAGRAQYQKDNMQEDGSQRDMLRALEISAEGHAALRDHCGERGIGFLSTAFDFGSLDMLLDLGAQWIKIPSGDVTFGPMLLKAARTHLPIILSTGMATMDEIADALAVLAHGLTRDNEPEGLDQLRRDSERPEAQAALADHVTILHCVTHYPCPPEMVNLAAMDSIRARFGLPVGYSDHSLGIAIPIAAVARGAEVIEKHLTLDRTLPGPDHAASLEPGEFAEMVAGIRAVEQAMGTGEKVPGPVEMETRAVARRSLVAAAAIRAGDVLSESSLSAKRPGTGLSPMHHWDMAGRVADRDYAIDDLIAS